MEVKLTFGADLPTLMGTTFGIPTVRPRRLLWRIASIETSASRLTPLSLIYLMPIEKAIVFE
jgi:hypothetical protein